MVVDRTCAFAADGADAYKIAVAIVCLYDHVLVVVLVLALRRPLATLGRGRGHVILGNLRVLVSQAVFAIRCAHVFLPLKRPVLLPFQAALSFEPVLAP